MSNLGGGVSLGVDGDYSIKYSSYKTIQDSYDTSKALFSEAGCNQTAESAQVACFETVPALTLVELSDVARYVVQDVGKNASTAHVPVMFGILADDDGSFVTYPKTPVKDELSGLELINNVSPEYAQSMISSGLYPSPDTGNLTLDTFNISSRLHTDVEFRCVDQSTVYARTRSGAFPSAYFYQLDRSIAGYDPNNVGNPPVTASHPLGDPSLPYFKLHAGDLEFAFGTILPTQTREPQD
ncbi:Hypothetical protein R9X50_00644900 [Acrodontium crateriforme]|uniref:Uncharacterized protein n=1 Tax=Acrodontium crateriforme TaxID=150365 RepID=A0AAQ3RDM0_9PEZI|nr:Hypothetical protein R9X50_00644900 [Acrodontium crateriforme]